MKAEDYDALYVPGGFGAAKNLSDFGFKGAEMTVQQDVMNCLNDFRSKIKVIGLSCIAPIVAAKTFGQVEITLGKSSGENWPYAGSIEAAKSFGVKHHECDIDGVCVDKANNLVTVPAYMKGDAKPHEVFDNMD